jgi:transcription antitermination factor NusG
MRGEEGSRLKRAIAMLEKNLPRACSPGPKDRQTLQTYIPDNNRGPAMRWFAVAVMPRHEKSAATSLEYKGLDTFLPLYRKFHQYKSRTREFDLPVFPGYVFCRFDISRCLPVLGTTGVIQILGCGRTPVPVDEEEMLALQTVATRKLAMEPCPFVQVGETVRIKEGPLAGVRGTVIRVRNMVRVVLSITLLMRSVSVEVDASCLDTDSGRDVLPSGNLLPGTMPIEVSDAWAASPVAEPR